MKDYQRDADCSQLAFLAQHIATEKSCMKKGFSALKGGRTMNCFYCKIPCEYSNPLGYCIKEQSESPYGPWDKGNEPSGIQDPIRAAAFDLVDAVERYVEPKPGQKFVHRSEILLKKNALKELLK